MSAELLDLARSIAVRAAGYAATARTHGVEVAATKSSETDVVTAVDRDTEDLIRSLILDARPDDSILGEEGSGIDGTSGLSWIVDPIDGTVNFLYGLANWGVSIAVVDGPPNPAEWRALAGVVAQPTLDLVFEASAGGGARANGRELHVNTGVPLELALVGTGFGYSAGRRAEQAAVVAQLLPQVRDIRRLGSAALDLCAVASGALDAYYERGLNPWDLAAGALIAEEAGARVGGFDGAPADDRMLIAAAPELFGRLHDAVLAASGA